MKTILLLLTLTALIISCGDTTDSLGVDDVINAAEDSSTTIEEDTSLTAQVTNWAFFADTTLEVTGVIVKVAVDSSSLSSVATLAAGESLSVDAEGKVAVIKRLSLDSVILVPTNLPAKYLDNSMLNSYVKVLCTPTKTDIPLPPLENAKIVAIKGITEYDPTNINLDILD